MVKKKKTKKISQGLAIASLLINIFLVPGLGTIIGGRWKTGLAQIILFVLSSTLIFAGVILSTILIGIPILIAGGILYLGAWVWAIVSGIQLIKESEQ